MFDVGAITRELQQRFSLFCHTREECAAMPANAATPENLSHLLASLQSLTEDMAIAREGLSDWMPDAAIQHWDTEFVRWRGRLGAYIDAVDAAPPNDRGAVLWSVTAPLLLGFYGGQASKLPQQPLDAVTPFSLANQLAVDEAWRDERLRLLRQDLADAVKGLGEGLGMVLTIAGVGLALWAFGRRRR